MNRWETRLVVAGTALAIIAGIMLQMAYHNYNDGHILLFGIQGTLAMMFVVLTVILFHVLSLRPANSHSVRSLVFTYYMNCAMKLMAGYFARRKLLRQMRDPQKVQDELLMSILEDNSQTDFSKDHGLDKIKTREEFIKKFPINDYSVYEKYVERIAKGEDNVMTKAKVRYLSISSGTTGKNKMYPLTFTNMRSAFSVFLAFSYNLQRVIGNTLGRSFYFRIFHPSRKSEAGISMGGAGMAHDRQSLNDLNQAHIIRKIEKDGPSYFVQAILFLRDPDVSMFQGVSSDLVYSFFKSMELNKEKLCKAIATGHIDSFPGLADEVRQEVNELLVPDPERAMEVDAQISRGSDRLAKRLWPPIKFVFMAKSGGYEHSAKIMSESYFQDLKIGFGMHLATEGIYNVAMSPEAIMQEKYTFMPNIVFLEFIKIDDIENEDPETLLLEELKLGQMYEIVVTNRNGLYRNRFGDVVKVVGFTEKTPEYIFQYRTGQILNCAFDRTPEKVFYEAVRLTEAQWKKIAIVNYTCTESIHLEAVQGTKHENNHYIAFVETEEIILDPEQCSKLENNLCTVHESYKEFREQESIGPLEITQVKPGTFEGIHSVLWGENPNTQFKMPRVLRRQDALCYLWQNRLQQTS